MKWIISGRCNVGLIVLSVDEASARYRSLPIGSETE